MKWRILKDARTVLLLYRVKPSEYKLNKHIIDTYGLDLVSAGFHLLGHCKVYNDLNKNIIIMFPDGRDDELASLITYGNGEIKGSNILKEAFFRKD